VLTETALSVCEIDDSACESAFETRVSDHRSSEIAFSASATARRLSQSAITDNNLGRSSFESDDECLAPRLINLKVRLINQDFDF
jgi:hypothetical protein